MSFDLATYETDFAALLAAMIRRAELLLTTELAADHRHEQCFDAAYREDARGASATWPHQPGALASRLACAFIDVVHQHGAVFHFSLTPATPAPAEGEPRDRQTEG